MFLQNYLLIAKSWVLQRKHILQCTNEYKTHLISLHDGLPNHQENVTFRWIYIDFVTLKSELFINFKSEGIVNEDKLIIKILHTGSASSTFTFPSLENYVPLAKGNHLQLLLQIQHRQECWASKMLFNYCHDKFAINRNQRNISRRALNNQYNEQQTNKAF